MTQQLLHKMKVDEAMFRYIAGNAHADTCKLLLKKEPNLTFDKNFAVVQIECRRKARNKIPELLSHERFLFPKPVSAEQCTHEVVARFHASLLKSEGHVLDMTMGLGVDDYYIARQVQSLTAIELDPLIAEVGAYNFAQLNPRVQVLQGDSTMILAESETQYDAIFIDPARRGDGGRRLYGLADCLPNVLDLMPLLKTHARRLYIKASPMVDVTQVVRELGASLSHVWAVSVKNECKELFFKLDFERPGEQVTRHALNYEREWCHFECDNATAIHAHVQPARVEAGVYLYEPNASIMKLGCFDEVAREWGVSQLAGNSHLYVSSRYLPQFHGRAFLVEQVVPFNDQQIRALAKQRMKLNIATRNFKLSAQALKRKLKAQDGGEQYLFATTLAAGEQVLLLCVKPSCDD